jgi:hypothetical protein
MSKLHILAPIPVTPADQAAIDARLQRHLYGKAKCLPTSSGAAANSAGNMVDGSSPPARANSHYLDTAAAGRGATADEGSPLSTKPSLSARREAVVAWDLTLRCPVCNSNVEGNRREYHCFTCERRGR